jgi:hypothetical protein
MAEHGAAPATAAWGVVRDVFRNRFGVQIYLLDDEVAAAAELIDAYAESRVAERSAEDAVLAEVVAWARGVFPGSTPTAKAKHLLKEAAELEAAPNDPLEIADVLMIAEHLRAQVRDMAAEAGIDVADAIKRKLAIVRERTWAPGSDGVVEHVRATTGDGAATEGQG